MLCCSIILAVIIVLISLRYFLSSARLSDLSRRYVFITGCGSGFGRILACKLDSMGVNVFAACLTKQGMDSLRAECSSKLVPVQLDVTKEEMVIEVARFVKSKLPDGEVLWGLVNNAGIDLLAPVDWAPTLDMRQVLEVNTWGTVYTTRAFLPLIKKAKGRIVNVTSVASRLPYGAHPAYTMSKFAARGFSECLRVEMRHFGVSVHTIEPDIYKTSLADGDNLSADIRRVWNGLDEGIKKEYGHNYIERICDETKKLAAEGNPRSYEVADAIVHALFSVYPKERYNVGIRALIALAMWLPGWITDKMQKQFPPPCPD